MTQVPASSRGTTRTDSEKNPYLKNDVHLVTVLKAICCICSSGVFLVGSPMKKCVVLPVRDAVVRVRLVVFRICVERTALLYTLQITD